MLKKFRYFPIFFVLTFTCLVSSAKAGDDVPQWLQEAARLPTPSYEIKDVPAVILKNEETVNVESDGTITHTVRFAVRVLVREGRSEAIAHAVYETDSEKVRDINAWLIRRSGPMKSYGKKETVDLAMVDNDLYNEARVKYISAEDEAGEGDVFGYETVTQQNFVFSQFVFEFQHRLPVIHSQFNLNLPTGWKADSVTFNKEKVEPSISGSSYVWIVSDLQPIRVEAESPSVSSMSPRLSVSFFPEKASLGQVKTFANWSEVARWMAEIEDPQMTVDDALAVKTHELTDGAKTELDKIRAIARFVQKIQYISIQTGLGKGGGYKPHLSTDVFAKSYGDCKDKANLMRAMLSVVKIPAYMVSITADDATFVRAEWASPYQFNHCIIAIKVSDDTKTMSVVNHPALGRLMIFDPTDPYTQVGELPEAEQGSLALIDHKDSDSLLRMPVLPPETNRLERKIDVSLDAAGSISGSVNEHSIGATAVMERARSRELSAAAYNRMIENWISRGAAGAKTTKIEPKDDPLGGSFSLDVDFSAAGYAQIMQGKLMVFKPAVIGRLERLSFTEGKRLQPFVLDATSYSETVKIKLPTGFSVDEIPDPINLDTAFGKYTATYKVDGEFLVFARSLSLSRSSIPADRYDTVRDFFGRIHSAEQSPVVLMKK